MIDVIKNIRENNFSQGSVLLIAGKIVDENDRELQCGSRSILISQNCDIVCDIQKEPFIELLHVKLIEAVNGNYTKGKNPRILHLNLGNQCVECKICDRTYVDKSNLINPNIRILEKIPDDVLKILIYWLKNRYERVAFPDEFNRRFKLSYKEISKIISRYGKNIKGIFLRLSTFNELLPSEDYIILLVILVDPVIFENSEEMKKIDTCFERIVELLSKIEGIKLLDSESKVCCTKDISIYELEQYHQWDLDYLSYE